MAGLKYGVMGGEGCMGQEKEIPSGGGCSRGDYGSVQETLSAFSRSLVAFFKESCGLFKESYDPFQGVL